MAEVKSIGEFYDPTKTLNAYVGMQHVALQNQQLQQQQANMEIDNQRQAAQLAITEDPKNAAGPYNAYRSSIGLPPITDANAFVANPKPFWDQLNFPPGSPEWKAASETIDNMGVTTRKRSEAEFNRQGMLQGAGELITKAGGEATPGMKSFMAQSEQGQRQVTEAIFDPSKQAVAELNKEHMAQKARINAELLPLLDLGVDSGRALKEMATLTPQIAAIQAQYDKDKPALGITKAAGKRQDAVLGNPDLTAYRTRAAESVPKIEQALAQVKQEIDQATKDAHHLFAGTKPQTTDDSVHVTRGTMSALNLKEQYLQSVLALAKDPLNPTKHQAVEQLAKTIDARAGELYQSRTALDLRHDANMETARKAAFAEEYDRRVGLAQQEALKGGDKSKVAEIAAKYSDKQYQVKPTDVLGAFKDPNAPTTRIALTEETAEGKVVGAGHGQEYLDSQKSGRAAIVKVGKLNRMESLLSGVQTGKLTPAMTEIQAVGEALGIKVDPSLGSKQALIALSNEIALDFRNPAGGAGMPGNLSNYDLQFLRSMPPDLAKTPEGNTLIIDTARQIAERDIKSAQMARDYRKKHQHIDEGFYDELAAYAEAHPLFKDKTMPGASTMTPGVPNPKAPFHDPAKEKKYQEIFKPKFRKEHVP